MKRPQDRGEFGNWLRDARKERFVSVPLAATAMQAEIGYGIQVSTWAELEAGTRRPTQEQRERLEAFFGVVAPPESPPAQGSDLAALVAAQTAVLSEIRDELRLSRLLSERSARVLAELLGANAESLDRVDTPDASDARAPLGIPGRLP